MEKYLQFLLMSAMLFLLSSCMYFGYSDSNGLATLNYNDGTKEIHVTLTEEETGILRGIVNRADFGLGGASCGFLSDVSFTVGGIEYQVACDTCPIIRKGIFDSVVSEKDIKNIHSIFEKYGGRFPCI